MSQGVPQVLWIVPLQVVCEEKIDVVSMESDLHDCLTWKSLGVWRSLSCLMFQKLGDLLAALFMHAELPCPGLLGSSCGLRLGHVQMVNTRWHNLHNLKCHQTIDILMWCNFQWFETYLTTMKSPLTCNGVAASTTFARAGKPGMGCWIVTLKHRDGIKISRESPSVVTLVRKFQVSSYYSY